MMHDATAWIILFCVFSLPTKLQRPAMPRTSLKVCDQLFAKIKILDFGFWDFDQADQLSKCTTL